MQIFVMAQGRQERLPSLKHSKHLLEVNGEPIIVRTLRLLREFSDGLDVTVIGHQDVLQRFDVMKNIRRGLTLKNPGFCILDGLYETLSSCPPSDDRVIFLLGDVVFSRDALQKILANRDLYSFAGTNDLSKSKGELFAFGYNTQAQKDVELALSTTPCRKVPVGKNQPGHLRNLLVQIAGKEFAFSKDGAPPRSIMFLPIDDWTADIDTEKDLEKLPFLSQKCLEENHG